MDVAPGYAAAELDRDPGHLCEEREAIVGTLIFAGPRAHEIGYMLEREPAGDALAARGPSLYIELRTPVSTP